MASYSSSSKIHVGGRAPLPLVRGTLGARLLFPAMLGLACLLCGCAVMSESECVTADWYLVGERDGRDGRPLAHLAQYYDACSQYGIYPDEEAYRDGRDHGLTVYCTEDGGYQEGRVGLGYRGVCPVALEPYFLQGYNVGIAVRETLERVHQIDYQIHSAEEQIEDLRAEIGDFESSEGSGEEDPETLKQKYRELGRLEGELEGLHDQKVGAVVSYRRAVDVARSMGFYEHYEY